MSEPDELDLDDSEAGTDEDPKERNWRALREKAEQAKALIAERDALLREIAFRDAGLDVANNKQHARFAKGYDGPIDAAVIRQTATDEGFLGVPQQQQQEAERPVTDMERRAFTDVSESAAKGDTPVELPNPDSYRDELLALGRKGLGAKELDAAFLEVMRRYNRPIVGG